jgi:hypothetical protein
MKSKVSHKLLVGAALLALSACGSDDNTPDPDPVNVAPTVSADDTTAIEGSAVSITASGQDTDGTIASYAWTQKSGTTVELAGSDAASVSFTAPTVVADEALEFTVTVTDDGGATAATDVTVSVTANMLSLTLQGIVTDSPIENANVEVMVGDQSFETIADEQGSYNILIEVDDSYADEIVTLKALGDSTLQPEVEFVSQLASFNTLTEEAGADGILDNTENFGVDVTNVTTAEYALITREGSSLTTDTELNTAINAINSVEKNTLSALIKIVVDNDDFNLPSSVTSTLSLVSDSVTANAFEQDVAAQNPSLISETIKTIVNDNSLTSESAIVGSWKFGTDVITFMRSGHYMHISTSVEIGDEDCAQIGYEIGTYNWNSTTGALSVTTTEDTGGCGGLHDGGPLNTLDIKDDTFTVIDNTLSVTDEDETFNAPRLVSDSNPLVGGFYTDKNNFNDDLSMEFTLDDNKLVSIFSFDKTQLPEGVSYLYIMYDYSYDAASSERLLHTRTIYVNGEITQELPEYLSSDQVNIQGDVIWFVNENYTYFIKNSDTTTTQSYLSEDDIIGDFSGTINNGTFNFDFTFTFNADGTGQSNSDEGETPLEWKVVYGQLLITFEGDGDSQVWSPTSLANDVWLFNVISYNGDGVRDGDSDGTLTKDK